MVQILKDILFDGKITFPIKLINTLSYYITPAILIFILWGYYLTWNNPYEFSVELWEKAFLLLLIILFIKPLAQIFVDIKLLGKFLIIRRQLWVIIFWFFLAHGVCLFLNIWVIEYIAIIKQYKWQSYYLWGSLWWVIIFLLGITSNTQAVKLLKRNWKRLHSLVYLALFFIVLHIYFISWESWSLIIFIVFCILKLIAKKWFKIILRK